MTNQPLVVAIIVNWNRKDLLAEAISSLLNDGYTNLKIIVIDNASSDGSVDYVRQKSQDVFVIENKRNVGYSRGNNQGITIARDLGADYFFFLNNDATLMPGCLGELVRIFKDNPQCGAASPFIVYADNPDMIWFGGGEVSLWSGQVRHKHIRMELDTSNYKIETTDYITGCALMVRRSALDVIGGFDEIFALYSEDVDLCLRLRKSGWQLIVTPLALAVHRVSASTGGGLSPLKAFYRARSTALLLKRWAPPLAWGILPIAGTLGLLAVSVGLLARWQISILKAIWSGIFYGMLGNKIPVRYRLDFTN